MVLLADSELGSLRTKCWFWVAKQSLLVVLQNLSTNRMLDHCSFGFQTLGSDSYSIQKPVPFGNDQLHSNPKTILIWALVTFLAQLACETCSCQMGVGTKFQANPRGVICLNHCIRTFSSLPCGWLQRCVPSMTRRSRHLALLKGSEPWCWRLIAMGWEHSRCQR